MYRVVRELFGDMPREFGRKRTYIEDGDVFFDSVKKYNGLIDIYTSVYSIPKYKGYADILIDKLYFDFDKYDGLDKVRIMHYKLMEVRVKHMILFTGRGFAVYVFTEKMDVINKKEAIRNAQEDIAKVCGLTIGEPKTCDIDRAVIGDWSRITRVPTTLNLRHDERRYCFSLSKDDLMMSYDDIKEKAINQITDCHIFGENLFNIKNFDYHNDTNKVEIDFDETVFIDRGNHDFVLTLLPPFIQHLLVDGKDGRNDRFLTILALREVGLSISEQKRICKKYWSTEKFRHSCIDEKQFYYVNKSDLFFPNWETVAKDYKISKADLSFSFYRR